jgi:glycine dehydrogenase subunit 1
MYSPHTEAERQAMLQVIGVDRLEDLFHDVPHRYRFPDLALPPGLSEMEVDHELQSIALANETPHDLICFLGAGAYQHYIPAAVKAIISRGEFLSSYTPYQPEISQGTLQAIFEYQSLIAALTGMDVCNASHYDGATAVAEAISMAYANFRGKRNRILISPALNPQYLETARTYVKGSELVLEGCDPDGDPMLGPDCLIDLVDQQTALVVVQYPDFFGRIFDYRPLAEKTHQAGGLFAVAVNPLALGILTPPGEFGADIVTGEGQPLGIPLSFGGPYLGIFATKKEYVRKMAGRLVGETVDNRGQRAYVLTLTAREQHIRREKATSNICTNQGLMALASTVYMSLLGKQGLQEVAGLCYHKAHYAADRIASLPGCIVEQSTAFFNEFVVRCPVPALQVNQHLLDHNILGGYEISQAYPNHPKLENCLLVAVTEMNSREEIDLLVEALAEVPHD